MSGWALQNKKNRSEKRDGASREVRERVTAENTISSENELESNDDDEQRKRSQFFERENTTNR